MRALVAVAVLVSACSPYERRSGEYFAGAVDPAAFPAPYLGAGGDPKHSGGVILASNASAHTDPAPYYAFAVSTALPATGYAPLVAEVPVTSNGEGCQSIKSSATLVTTSDVVVDTVPPKFPIPNAKPTGVPDCRFLAWAI